MGGRYRICLAGATGKAVPVELDWHKEGRREAF